MAHELHDPFANLGLGGYDSGATTAYDDGYFAQEVKPSKVKDFYPGKGKNDIFKNDVFVETKYEGWQLEKAKPLDGERASWSRVTKRELPYDEKKLAAMSKKWRTGSKGLHTEFQDLKTNQQDVITRLRDECNAYEKNRNTQWTIDSINKTEEKKWKTRTIECTKIFVIFKRQTCGDGKVGQRLGSKLTGPRVHDNIIDLEQPVVEMKKAKPLFDDGFPLPKSAKAPKHPKVPKTERQAQRSAHRPVQRMDHDGFDGFDGHAGRGGHGHGHGRDGHDMPLVDPFQQDNFGLNHQGLGIDRVVEAPMPPRVHDDPFQQFHQDLHRPQQQQFDQFRPQQQQNFPQEPFPQHNQPQQHHVQQQNQFVPQHQHQQHQFQQHQGPPGQFPVDQFHPQLPQHDFHLAHAGHQPGHMHDHNNPFTPHPAFDHAGLHNNPHQQDFLPRARSMSRLDDHHEPLRRRSSSRAATKEIRGIGQKVKHSHARLDDKLDAVLDKIDAWNPRPDDHSSDGSYRDRDFWGTPGTSIGTPGTSPAASPHRGDFRRRSKTSLRHGGYLAREKRSPRLDRRYTDAVIVVPSQRERRTSYLEDHPRRESQRRPRLIHAKTYNDYPEASSAERGDGYFDADFADRGRRRRQNGSGAYWDEEPRGRVYVEGRRGSGRKYDYY